MNNNKILNIAMNQSAIDLNCNIEAFNKFENVIVYSKKNKCARKYLELPFECNLVSYGNNIVASIQPDYYDIVEAYISKYDVSHCFETPNIHVIDEAFSTMGLKVCFMAEYFLPNINELKISQCNYKTKIMSNNEFTELYTKQWSNALCKERKELDILGIGAFDNDKLIGLAACSADCDTMWQIGVDVLPEYRKKGIASSLTSRLAVEIINKGRVPFYCCAWCNIKSARNAIKSGFRPAWAEMTIKPKEIIDKINKI